MRQIQFAFDSKKPIGLEVAPDRTKVTLCFSLTGEGSFRLELNAERLAQLRSVVNLAANMLLVQAMPPG